MERRRQLAIMRSGGQGGKVEYSGFRTYEIYYAVSLASVVAVAVVYLILRKRLLEK